MTSPPGAASAQSVFDFWAGLMPEFFRQVGGNGSGAAAPAFAEHFAFPADAVAHATAMTQASLQAMSQAYAPWMAAMPGVAAAGSTTAAPANSALGAPLQAMTQMAQAWLDFGQRLSGTSPQDVAKAFDRTYGAVSDALGFGPLRQFQSAWQDVLKAGLAQQHARGAYALLVQRAFASGFDKLLDRLAERGEAGERVDSVFALLRLWATCTEDAVHETLQSEPGLAATAALTRAALAHRKRLREAADIVADMLDMATRRDLDDAYREIQALKRELRALRPAPTAAVPTRSGRRKASA